MISFPFDNASESVRDRAIGSDVFAQYLKRIVGTNGVFAELGTKCQVVSSNGMYVTVKAGDGFIEGRLFVEERDRTLQLEASSDLDRIDTVVARLDLKQRTIDYYIVKGISASKPKAPKLTREAGIYEIGLADVFVAKQTSNISQERISDTRLNSERCGVVPIFGSVDTTALYEQIQIALNRFETESFAEFNQWFHRIKGQLSTDAAGNLQNQIDIASLMLQDMHTEINGILAKLKDTGWKTLKLSTNWKRLDNEYCVYRKIGNVVEIRFYVVALNDINTNVEAKQIASGLPTDCQPSDYTVMSVATGQGKSFTIYVYEKNKPNDSGYIRFRNKESKLSAGYALMGQVTYTV